MKIRPKMSDNIPFELQAEIIKRVLPVKSLIRFRSVSKQWKSLIDSSEFITHHTLNNKTQPQHLLVRYPNGSEIKYVSIVDDDSFPRHKFSPTVSPTAKLLTHPRIIASSHGLVCLCGFAYELKKHLIILWNPSIRKSVEIVFPYTLNALGFGVCPKTMDPKIVNIIREANAQVYTLSSGAWRHISINLRVPGTGFSFRSYHEVIDGIIYWVTCNESGSCDKIISFNLTSEEFGLIEVQDSLEDPGHLCISKVKESVVVLNYDKSDEACGVWMMTKNVDPKSLLIKLFTVSFKAFHDSIYHRIVGFRKNDQPIIEHHRRRYGFRLTTLEVYEPCTEQSNDIGTDLCFMINNDSRFMTTFHTESLLLLNHPGSIAH
ncbi:putative F-box domain-containing protein [Helianthus annuus]|uniref:putative F-box protein At1g47790 n=1 Tax=Helianthus annuus TaxID=4232 RepID=UPI000B8FD1F5|nr:putative F-box protein At1g47790 [Helianthus annuus]KAJ0906676.1 putative F-box domain-containing protein [Helianthus annuus]